MRCAPAKTAKLSDYNKTLGAVSNGFEGSRIGVNIKYFHTETQQDTKMAPIGVKMNTQDDIHPKVPKQCSSGLSALETIFKKCVFSDMQCFCCVDRWPIP